MLSALSAEALKMRRHKATWFLVWLFPIAFTIILLIAIGAGMAGFESPDQQKLEDWIGDTAVIWAVPNNSFGRYLISAFVVVLFAGEYGWNTWKLIVPHRSRTSLIAAKYALAVVLFAISFALTAVITLGFTWLDDVLTGDTIPAGITAAGILEVHGQRALAALPPVLIALAYASFAAVLTRSTIAALVIAIVLTTFEQVIFTLGPLMSMRFPGLINVLYHVLPGYHLANIGEWITDGMALSRPFPAGNVIALSWTTSVAVVAAWVAALVAATFATFRRQDIN